MQSSHQWLALVLVVLVTIGQLRVDAAPAEESEKPLRKAREPKIRRTIRVVEEPPAPATPEVATPTITSAPPQAVEMNNSGSSNSIDVNPSISVGPASPPPPPTHDEATVESAQVSEPAATQPPTQELSETTGSGNQVVGVTDTANNKLAQLIGNSNNELIQQGANNGNVVRRMLENSGNLEEVHLSGVGNRKVTRVSNAGNQEEEQLVDVANTRRPVAQPVSWSGKAIDLSPLVQINLNNNERFPERQQQQQQPIALPLPGFVYSAPSLPLPAPVESSTGLGVSLPAELKPVPVGSQVANYGPQLVMQPLPVAMQLIGQPWAAGYPVPMAVQPGEPMMLVNPREWRRLMRAQRKCRRNHHDDEPKKKTRRARRNRPKQPRPHVIEIHHKPAPEVVQPTTTTTTTPAPETTTTTTTTTPAPEPEEEEVVEWETVRVPKKRMVKRVKSL